MLTGCHLLYLAVCSCCALAAARRTFNTLGVGVPALSLVWLAFVGCDVLQAAVAMCLCLGSNGLIYGGLFVRRTQSPGRKPFLVTWTYRETRHLDTMVVLTMILR